jgi:glycosyltransferase involved in cell wall biosynthesis
LLRTVPIRQRQTEYISARRLLWSNEIAWMHKRQLEEAMINRTVIQVLDFVPRGQRSMEIFLVTLAKRLRERGWQSVHVFSGEVGDYMREALREIDSQFLVEKMPLTRAGAKRLGERLRPYQPDVLQTHFLSKFSPAIRTLKRSMKASHMFMTDQTSGRVSSKSLLGRFLAWLRGTFAGTYTDRAITVSDWIRQRDVNELYLPPRIMRLVYNGVDVRKYAPIEISNPGELTIGFVGQLIPEKGVLTLLRAVHELVREGCTIAKVLIAGKGPQEDQLRQYCTANGLTQVEFLGQIDWVPKVFSICDLIVIPSEWEEACSFAVIEALACGACLLVSDAGGNPELVGPEGVAGLVFRRGDVPDLKLKLRELIAHPQRREAMRQAARDRAVSRFSIDRMVDGYLAVFDEIAAELTARRPTAKVTCDGPRVYHGSPVSP